VSRARRGRHSDGQELVLLLFVLALFVIGLCLLCAVLVAALYGQLW